MGDLGAMWVWRAETGLWEKDPAAPLNGFQGNLDGIAFAPGNPGARLRGRAERRAALLRQELDAGSAAERLLRSQLHFRRVRRHGGDGRRRTQPARQRRLAAGRSIPKCTRCLPACPSAPTLNVVAGLPNGGRWRPGATSSSSATAPGRPGASQSSRSSTRRPSPPRRSSKAQRCARCCRSCPTSNTRRGSCCRRSIRTRRAPLIPPNPLPGDGYLLRETPAGWEDEERAAYAGDTNDKPIKADPIAALDVGPVGSGLGGRRLERPRRRRRTRQRRHRRLRPGDPRKRADRRHLQLRACRKPARPSG